MWDNVHSQPRFIVCNRPERLDRAEPEASRSCSWPASSSPTYCRAIGAVPNLPLALAFELQRLPFVYPRRSCT
jgi:hypothetical protein